ncbi:hypothetical protein GGI42DRAFT_319566 [Trichoderma sp. SZMC 28013]
MLESKVGVLNRRSLLLSALLVLFVQLRLTILIYNALLQLGSLFSMLCLALFVLITTYLNTNRNSRISYPSSASSTP